MLETKRAFEHLDLSITSPLLVVQQVRERITSKPNPISAAQKLVHQLIGIEPVFKDVLSARLIAAKVAEMLVRANHHVDDAAVLLEDAELHVKKFVNDPANAWMWAEAETPTTAGGEVKAVVEGLDTKVEVKSDGSIKKGGKQILVAEMYKKNVLEATTPMSNQQFVALVMKDLGMSKAGATTYAYNAKKQLGEPEGGIVKAKKGRQAKEAA